MKRVRKVRMPNIDMKFIAIQGGDDLLTPSISVDPGRSLLSQNYEPDDEGRPRLIDGYEAFDGRPSPSGANYWILNFDAGSTEIAVGDTVTGAGGASGEVYKTYQEDGSWIGGTASGYLVLFKVTGTYVDDEVLSVGGGPVAAANGTALINGATTDTYDSIYRLAAIEDLRDDIAAVPGSGNVLGVWQHNGVKYAFRNNAGGTATVMHKSSTAGWVACDLGAYVDFTSGGTYEVVEGNTITGATSGQTAVVRRIILTSGTWAGGDAAGRFILSAVSGAFQAENLNVGANPNVATIAADATDITLLPSGRYEFISHNFGGHAGTRRMYGCDGVNKAFEWDGTTYVPITTGMTTDAPTHIVAHKNHLFLMFSGGSIQHSSPGYPYVWSVVIGAGEIGIGDEGTGFISVPNVLAIMTRNSTHLLYGSSIDDWDLKEHAEESGAIEWSIQKIGPGVYLDDRGLTSLAAVQEYGDFKANTISKYINPWLKPKIGAVQCSMRVKDKNQYRLFFNDKRVLTLTMDNNKVVGFMRQYYDDQVVCTCSTENSSGQEELFFGCDDGFVYQLDSGHTFNGDPIESVLKLHFNHLKSPQLKKRIRHIILELDAPIDTYINANVEFDYGETGNQSRWFDPESPGGIWEINNWDAFVWDGRTFASLPIDVDGTGLNFSLTLYHSGIFQLQETIDEEEFNELVFEFELSDEVRSGVTGAAPHTIQGYTVIYDKRAIQR